MIMKLAALLIWLWILPAVVGCLWTETLPEEDGSLAAAYFYGLFTVLALFEALAVPMTFLKCSLTLLTRVWALLVLALALASVRKNRTFAAQRRWLAGAFRRMTPVLAVALLCMALQAAYVTQREYIDDDDAFYLATATTSVEKDSLYRFNPYTGKAYQQLPSRYVLAAWPLFLATLSRLSGFHPAILAHMLLPAVVLLWTYLVYALFAKRLFPDDPRKQGLFLLFVAVLLSFSGYSRYSAATFLFIRGWQGKAVLAGVGIPALFYGAWIVYQERATAVSWLMLGGIVCSACLFTSMGVALSLVVLGCCALCAALLNRRWLYLPLTAAACLPALACGVVYVILR